MNDDNLYNISIVIDDENLELVTKESISHIKKIEDYINNQIIEIKNKSRNIHSNVNMNKKRLLICINITDKFLKSEQNNENLQEIISELEFVIEDKNRILVYNEEYIKSLENKNKEIQNNMIDEHKESKYLAKILNLEESLKQKTLELEQSKKELDEYIEVFDS